MEGSLEAGRGLAMQTAEDMLYLPESEVASQSPVYPSVGGW
jgi:hypothetical protein